MHDTDDFETVVPKPRKPSGPSLKARAIAYLSRREHSRRELVQKLAEHAPDAETLEYLLDDLEREDWLSHERFAHSLVNRRASRQGTMRIVQELRQHAVPDHVIASVEEELQASESDRARNVWEKKFGVRANDARSYARQYRFMMSRGFSSDCVRHVLGDMPR